MSGPSAASRTLSIDLPQHPSVGGVYIDSGGTVTTESTRDPLSVRGDLVAHNLGRGLGPLEYMPLAVSRRALLAAFLPSESRNAEPERHTDKPPAALLATVRSSTACVETRGVTCRRCTEACDHSAIRIAARERRGAVIDAAACTGCGDCVPVCPVEAIAIVPRERVELVSEVARLVAGHG